MFVTLTFEREKAPTEDEAHKALRSLVARLRYRNLLGQYGWVLQRQENGEEDTPVEPGDFEKAGTLHYHGIFHMPWFDDDLEEWRKLIGDSGFGAQNKIVIAKPKHAFYVSKYISDRLAYLNPLRRTYSFSRDFPRTDYELDKRSDKEFKKLLGELGVEPEHDWWPSGEVASWLR